MKPNPNTALFWLGLAAILLPSLHAATYYVDFERGNDASPGTSLTTPWQHCPGDSNAVSSAGSASLKPGDTVLFKGGTAYEGEVDFKWSGTDGFPITYDGNSAATWGSGKAKMDCANRLYHAFAAQHLLGPHNHLIINNFDIVHLKNVAKGSQSVNTVPGSDDLPGTTNRVTFKGDGGTYSYGGIFVYGTDWLVTGCDLHESEQWGYRALAGSDPSAEIPCLQAGINALTGTNVVITNCAIWQIGRDCIR